MQKLFLATDGFPYGNTERNFVLPEIVRLQQYYDITVISHADMKQTVERAGCEELPENVRLVHFPRPIITAIDKIKALLLYIVDADGRREIREILADRPNRKERLYQSLSFWAQTLSDQKALRRSGLLSKDEPVIYYSFWYTYFCYSMIRERDRYPNVKVITRTHGHDLYHERVPGGRQPFKHQMEDGLERIVFACEYGRQYYEKQVMDIRTGSDKLKVCKLGTDPARRGMPIGNGEEWQLVSCSNAIPLKRIELIIDGLAQITEYNIHWTHIGDGSDLARLQEYAGRRLKQKKNIRYTFAGYIRNVALFYEQHQVDCFITTSSTEGGCPVSIQEAMSYGIPIIGTAVGGITEMIADNGILLSKDPHGEEVADVIGTIAGADKEIIDKMKESSYARWKAEFDINDSFQRILAELQAISS